MPPHIRYLITFAIIALQSGCAGAQNAPKHTPPLEQPAEEAFANEVAQEHNLDPAWIKATLKQARKQQSILDAISRPAEKKKPWHEYRTIFLTPERIDKGAAFWRQHRASLAKAEQTYGVPQEIIVAIIGVETLYGKITGKYRVLDALYTLAFHYPPRSPFFRSELSHFLVMSHEEQLDPLRLTGSYAGAMGLAQFMPSSYRRWAVDFDNDHKRDLWTNPIDAIGSVGNYLAEHGWQRNALITVPAQTQGHAHAQFISRELELNQTLDGLLAAGVKPQVELAGNPQVRLLELQQAKGPEHWIALQNFYAITRYNHSALYAMAVYQLGQAIKRKR